MQSGSFEACPVSASGCVRLRLRAFEGPDLQSLAVDALRASPTAARLCDVLKNFYNAEIAFSHGGGYLLFQALQKLARRCSAGRRCKIQRA